MSETTWNPPGYVVNVTNIGTRTWSPETAANLAQVDSTNVRVTGINTTTLSKTLRVTNFGFNIPPDSVILGVELAMVRRRTFGSGLLIDRSSFLTVDSGNRTSTALDDRISDERPSSVPLENSNTTATYGGATDTWNAPLTASIINDPNFGFDYAVSGTTSSFDMVIDQLLMKVYYEGQAVIRKAPRSSFWL